MDNSKHQVITDFLNYIKNVRRYSSHTIRSYCHDLEGNIIEIVEDK